jgi:hypothetical protein
VLIISIHFHFISELTLYIIHVHLKPLALKLIILLKLCFKDNFGMIMIFSCNTLGYCSIIPHIDDLDSMKSC